MVSSPIGGFMPIPLAIMPPFMAYQSLLMGDSFGKGFQYGKRKISAMSNEEFNNLNLPALFKDSMAEYESMIPTVEQAMQNSTKLQNSIIEKMLRIIPDLLAKLFGGTGDKTTTNEDSPFLKNQTDVAQNATIQAMQATIQNIRYTTDRDPVLNKPAIAELQKQLDKLMEQSGTKESLAEKIATENQPSSPPPPPPPHQEYQPPPPNTAKQDKDVALLKSFTDTLGANAQVFEKAKSNYYHAKTRNPSHMPFYMAQMKSTRNHIVRFLRDSKPTTSDWVALLNTYRRQLANGSIFSLP